MIVLLSGKQGSGKTTLKNLLLKNYARIGYRGAMAFRFAETIYAIHDYGLDLLRQAEIEDVPKKDGELLQIIGLYFRKKYGEDIWIKILKSRLARYDHTYTLFVIEDCRFWNEFELFSDALRIRLVASEEVRKSRADAWRDNTAHQSEVDLDNCAEFDLFLDTEKTSPEGCLELVLAQLDKGIDRIKEKREL